MNLASWVAAWPDMNTDELNRSDRLADWLVSAPVEARILWHEYDELGGIQKTRIAHKVADGKWLLLPLRGPAYSERDIVYTHISGGQSTRSVQPLLPPQYLREAMLDVTLDGIITQHRIDKMQTILATQHDLQHRLDSFTVWVGQVAQAVGLPPEADLEKILQEIREGFDRVG